MGIFKKKLKKDVKKKIKVKKKDVKMLAWLAKHAILSELPGPWPRTTFDEYVGKKFTEIDKEKLKQLKLDWGSVKQGVRVSVFVRGDIYGNSGSFGGNENVYEDVIECAKIAGFHDNRFPNLKNKDIKWMKIEVSLIGESTLIEYNDPLELLYYLDDNRGRGVMVRKGKRQAYYLSDVWNQIPDPGTFISSLCTEASLPASAWKGEERLWPRKTTTSKRDIYTGNIIEPSGLVELEVYHLEVVHYRG